MAVTFRIRRRLRGRTKIVHVDRLWRYHSSGTFTWGQDLGESSSEEDAEAPDKVVEVTGVPDEVADGREADIGLTDGRETGSEAGAAESVGDLLPEPRRPLRPRRRPRRLQDYLFDEDMDSE